MKKNYYLIIAIIFLLGAFIIYNPNLFSTLYPESETLENKYGDSFTCVLSTSGSFGYIGDIDIESSPAVFKCPLYNKVRTPYDSYGNYAPECWEIPITIDGEEYIIPYGKNITVKLGNTYVDINAISDTSIRKDGTYHVDVVCYKLGGKTHCYEAPRFKNTFTFYFKKDYLNANLKDSQLDIKNPFIEVDIENDLTPGQGGIYLHQTKASLQSVESFDFVDLYLNFGKNTYKVDIENPYLGDFSLDVIPYLYAKCGPKKYRLFGSTISNNDYRVLPTLPKYYSPFISSSDITSEKSFLTYIFVALALLFFVLWLTK